MRQTIPIPIITAIASPMMMGSSFPPAMPFALYVLSDFIDRNQECYIEYSCSSQRGQDYLGQHSNFYAHLSSNF
jgi:hypothetical protein